MILPLLLGISLCSASADETVVHPPATGIHLRNPGMGLIYYGDRNIPEVADTLFVWIDSWDLVNPEPGVFRWDLPQVTNIVNACKASGRQAGIRILPGFHPRTHPLPAWLRDQGVRLLPRDDGDFKKGGEAANFEPEWWHPAYFDAYARFVKAFGKKFDGAPWLAFVDMRFYGFWGEGHRFGATTPWPREVDKRELLKKYLDLYLHAFRKTPLAVEAASDQGTPFPSGTAIDYAVDHGCWMRRDGFGPFIAEQETRFMEANWKRSLVIAENGDSYVSFFQGKVKKWWVAGSPVISLDDVFNQMFAHHVNYFPLGWGGADYNLLEKERPDLIRRASLESGYRFEVTEARWPKIAAPGQRIEVRTRWRNVAVGRLPFARKPVLRLLDANGNELARLINQDANPSEWIRGEDRAVGFRGRIPRMASRGACSWAISVESENGKNRIALGIEGDDGNRTYRLGTMELR